MQTSLALSFMASHRALAALESAAILSRAALYSVSTGSICPGGEGVNCALAWTATRHDDAMVNINRSFFMAVSSALPRQGQRADAAACLHDVRRQLQCRN